MAVKKQPRTLDEEGILKILNEAIQIIFTELKSIDSDGLQKTTGLLFASNLDYKTYKDKKKKENLIYDARRAASYILLDQLIFYDRLSSELPDKYPPLSPIIGTTLHPLKEKFERVLQNNYSAIFLSNIIPYLLEDEATVAAVNRVIGILSSINLSGTDILGKIFHRLIPLEIRKHIAAFYTSNVGGKLLIELSILKPEENVLDLACGSGTLLVEAYKRKKTLYNGQIIPENVLHQKLLDQLFGNDVVIFATHLATMNLALQSSLTYTDAVNVCIGDGFQLHPSLSHCVKESPKKQDFNGESEKTFAIPIIDVVTMNPPFTRHERVAKEFLTTIQSIIKQEGVSAYVSGKMSLQHYFLLHADTFLQKGGRLAFVIPTNTFNVDLSEKLIQFLRAKNYHLQYLIAVNSKKGTFSEGCNFKEYLFIAEKGELTQNSQTKLIMFSDLPSYSDVDQFLQVIRGGIEGITNSENGIELSIKTINTNTLYESNRWDTAFWDLNNKWLLNLFENDKFVILKDSQEFSFITGFHSTHCEYLILPNDFFSIERDLGDAGLEVKRVEDEEKVIIPRDLLRKCLREPKLYQNLYCTPSHWVLSIDRMTPLPVDFAEKVLQYTAKKLAEIVKAKAEKGGKVKAKLDPFWYCHPKETGCNTKTGILWTFNRYGLWLRANTSFLTNEEITGNDGFHIYNYSGTEDKRIALEILNSWFNSSIHIYDFLRKCRVPAIHVQQVLKNDREEMVVPIISKLSKQEIEMIISTTQKFAVTSQNSILKQFDQAARKELDKVWLSIMGIPKEQQEILLKELYEVLKYVIRKR